MQQLSLGHLDPARLGRRRLFRLGGHSGGGGGDGRGAGVSGLRRARGGLRDAVDRRGRRRLVEVGARILDRGRLGERVVASVEGDVLEVGAGELCEVVSRTQKFT